MADVVRTRGERTADFIAGHLGSWRLIIIQSLLIAIWMAFNVFVLPGVLHLPGWDRYPFVLLNLGLSLQAAYTGPVLLMSNKRAAAKTHAQNMQQLEAILSTMRALEAIVKATQVTLDARDEALEQELDELQEILTARPPPLG